MSVVPADLPETEEDPFLYDAEDLQGLAGEAVVRRGLAWFKENRVVELDREEDRLRAEVEDPRSDVPLLMELTYDPAGNLAVRCACEEAAAGFACSHAVAALLAYASRQHLDAAGLLSAADGAIEERAQRGRTEVKVEHLGGEPWFGTWRATSITSSTHFPQSYRVHLRSLQRRANYCTCPDFATNQLGTCKHIEAVLHRVRKRRDYKDFRQRPVPHPYVYLAWDVEGAPRVRLHRSQALTRDLVPILDEYFDTAGAFRGRMPDDFFRFAEAVADRTDIDVGEDAAGHARRLAADAAHRVRAVEIRERITRAGGQLPGVRARLYPYQVEGVAFLAANGRALLADDMGLGKTLQAIAAASWLRQQGEIARALVVCPASLKHQWAREIGRFTGDLVEVVQGSARARTLQYRRGEGFCIVNYELAMRDLSLIHQHLCPDLLVLDEAQRIKNWRTKVASAVKLIPARYAFVLSGTPLENRLEDLYSLMQVVDPRVLGPLWRYLAEFHVTDERGKVLGYRNLTELRRRLAPVMLRRDRRLVRDQLPARIEQRLDVPLTARQQEIHDGALSAASQLAQIARRRPLTASEQKRLMASLQEARMACDAAGLVDKETEGSPKLDELEQLVQVLCVEQGQKAVVFSQWERMTQMVESRLRRLGVGCVRLHGGVPSAQRGELVERFRTDDAVQVFVSTDAGGTGLNLQAASVVINLDVPWNPAVLEQRIARVHRLGQRETVQAVLLVGAGAYEERVLDLVRGKRELFDNVVTGEGGADVVGVSRKLLDALVEDLGSGPEQTPESPAAAGAVAEATAEGLPLPAEPAVEMAVAEAGPRAPAEPVTDPGVAATLSAIQETFGPRLERVLGTAGGLLVVLDRLAEADEAAAERLSTEVPVAVVDPRTLRGLARIGAGGLAGEARTYLDASTRAGAEMPRLLALARERLAAAEVLAGQGAGGPAVELLATALLAGAAHRAGLERAPTADQAVVWIHAQAVPRGWLGLEDAGLVTRALALQQAADVPASLVGALLADAHGFLVALAAPAGGGS
jgi:superfamily II DNA or RNA helicase